LSSAREFEKRLTVELRSAPEAVKIDPERVKLLEAVPKERLVKTQQAGKKFSGCWGDAAIACISGQ
jgi:hypothetical protein